MYVGWRIIPDPETRNGAILTQASNTLPDILAAIGALHEGVAEPDLWATGLDQVTVLVGASALMLGHSVPGSHRLALLGHRLPDAAVDLMSEPLGSAAANPYIAALPHLPLRRPVDHEDLGGQSVIENSRIWREIMQPFDFAWSMGAVLERQIAGTDFVMLGRSASRGPFERAEWENFQALIPHLARAYRVRRELEALRGLAADCMAALDHLNRGVVLVAGDGSIEFANRSAEAVFRDNDGLTAGARGLRTRRPREDAALQRIVRRAAETVAGKNSAAVGGMTAWRPSGKTPYTLVAEPLAPGHRERLGAPADSGAIVFIGGHGAPSPIVPRLALVYGLTPAEAGIAAGVAAGRGLAESARGAGVSVNTAKTHLKKVYAKMGVERASHLAARIAADIGGLSDIEVEPHPKG